MLHARIAARAFNTPLLVDPIKAMAFLSGLGPRVLGKQVELADHDCMVGLSGTAALPARASLLAGGLSDSYRQNGEAPFPVVDGIAVIEISGVLIHRGAWIGQSSGQTSYEGIAAQIEAAAGDASVRGVALEIDSFGGEVAGVFDLADRIRALRRDKPVWAFVAEHAFSAGYALASQASRILLPRTGALGSIGVVVMHADLSGKLDQDGMQVTLIHSGQHKVDGNPYAPLAETVRGDIQREIDVLRFLFAETVATGRAGRLSQEAALATEAATYRGADAVAAGLADEVTDLGRGFTDFRQMVAQRPTSTLSRTQRASLPHPRKETAMAHKTDDDNTAQDQDDTGGNAAPEASASPKASASPAEPTPAVPLAAPADPEASAAPTPAAAQPGNLAELSTRLRQEAAEITEIAAQAGRLGIAIDAAKALREGTSPEALRSLVLERASAAADARDVVAAPPSPVLPQATESPIVAAAKRAADAGNRV
ncbi:Peptidase family S49 [Salinihabitans flavidus]|uniref:Peptidase family S49 n=1 Tax=Salinihabitans flavidus TaxID=569882 RepID=A0A1H8UHK7_9RHOB|nr:S49 family peptidase [Salinihabitans flavidus]SEP02675.1 Peptidase family S49 [Salinihabitans flavidus]